ncbi:MAG: hypothetical protein WCQ87_01975 [Parabacteroides sp.]
MVEIHRNTFPNAKTYLEIKTPRVRASLRGVSSQRCHILGIVWGKYQYGFLRVSTITFLCIMI